MAMPPTILLVISLVMPCGGAQAPSLQQLRALYIKAPGNEGSCRELLRATNEASTPLIAGYKGAAMMIAARHVFNPITKLRYFNKGRALLEDAIRADITSAELRYLRFTIQTNAPRFLGYHDEMNEDRTLILQREPGIVDAQLREMIRTAMSKESGHL